MTPVPHPFSTTITWKVVDLVRQRDLHLLSLRNKRQANEITDEELMYALEQSLNQFTDDVLQACQLTIKPMESALERVLEIDSLMKRAHGDFAPKMAVGNAQV